MTEEPGNIEEGKAVPVLTSNDIKNIKIMELWSALQAIVMTTNVLKAVLVSRLEEAVENNVTLIQNIAPEVIEHSAGGEFASGLYWKKLYP